MAIIKKYRSETISVDNPPDIYVARFNSLDKKYTYKPGQYLHLALDEYDPSLPWPDSRCFSMQSSPTNDDIKITFSVKGAYTRRMAAELKNGKIVYLKLPYGELFSKSHSKKGCIFIAGGTGITPFLSLFTHPHFTEYEDPKLFFGLRSSYYNIYNDDIENAKLCNRQFSVDIAYEDKDGALNIENISRECNKDSVIFISGPPKMIIIFKKYL